MFDEDAYFGGEPAAGRSNRKDRHNSFERSEKTDDGAFPKFCREEPCRRLGDPKMFKDTHPHLLNIAGPEDSCGDSALCVLSGPNTPRLGGPTLDKNNRWKAAEILR